MSPDRAAVLVLMPHCPDSVGEQVVQIPFFHFLRAAHPGAEVVGVAPERSGSLIHALDLLDDFHTYPRHGGWGELAKIVRAVRSRRVETVYQLRKRSLRAALLARAATGAPMVGFRHGVNAALQQRSILFDTGRYIAESYAALLGRTTQDYADACAGRNDGYAVLVPAGRLPIKCYPIPKYVEIARELAGRLPVRVLLGPEMAEAARTLQASAAPLEVVTAPPMPEVSRLLGRAALVIANDCGPAHFAHVADVPRISLFDSTINADHWFFAGRRGRLLRSPGRGRIAEIPVGDILRHAHQLLEGGGSGPSEGCVSCPLGEKP
ncbi:MAG: glycosyltransferase family 9 protein [bacterium]